MNFVTLRYVMRKNGNVLTIKKKKLKLIEIN